MKWPIDLKDMLWEDGSGIEEPSLGTVYRFLVTSRPHTGENCRHARNIFNQREDERDNYFNAFVLCGSHIGVLCAIVHPQTWPLCFCHTGHLVDSSGQSWN
jgi:hypothetical protein